MSKSNEPLINELDRKFANFMNYNREIAIRKLELGLREADENADIKSVGRVGNPTETKVIKEISDQYIINRECWKKAISDTLEEQSEQIRELIYEKYWGKDSWMDWASFGEARGYSKATIYRIRQKVLFVFARKIGEM